MPQALSRPALVTSSPKADAPPRERPLGGNELAGEPAYELIELFFFAYRDFVGDPDRILAEFGFGRAHHRVLHFVDRQPGLTIAELLEILKITKQSLNRVLKELIETDFVVQEAGRRDRRQRHLRTTPRGSELARRLARLQTERLSRALGAAAAAAAAEREAVSRFLLAMIDPSNRAEVEALLAGGRERGR